MKYFVYVLRSLKNGDIYVGSTSNLSRRVIMHNSGKVRSTKGYRPWRLLEKHTFMTRSEAVKAEMFFKNHQQKDILKKKYSVVV